jgi:hypothetical protein
VGTGGCLRPVPCQPVCFGSLPKVGRRHSFSVSSDQASVLQGAPQGSHSNEQIMVTSQPLSSPCPNTTVAPLWLSASIRDTTHLDRQTPRGHPGPCPGRVQMFCSSCSVPHCWNFPHWLLQLRQRLSNCPTWNLGRWAWLLPPCQSCMLTFSEPLLSSPDGSWRQLYEGGGDAAASAL